jgi:hypothetical protein
VYAVQTKTRDRRHFADVVADRSPREALESRADLAHDSSRYRAAWAIADAVQFAARSVGDRSASASGVTEVQS